MLGVSAMDMQPISNHSGAVTASAAGRFSTANQSAAANTQKTASSLNRTGRNTVSYDARDLNQDGYVSALEEYLYAIMHPGDTASLNLITQYNSRGDVSTRVSGMPRLVDISV